MTQAAAKTINGVRLSPSARMMLEKKLKNIDAANPAKTMTM